MMQIRQITTPKEQTELDQFLWEVLWQPFDFARDVRQKFKLDKPHIDLVAFDGDSMMGAIVAYYLSDSEIEIRHMAVKSDMQGNSVGKNLVDRLITLVTNQTMQRIKVYARSTSQGFYARCGFKPVGLCFENPLFEKHGISIQPMHLDL
ncbi:MAG: GNAT family N-acetyltransferase [Chloroflexi bacterium]|nr:GNAT family N-acetyltransferase [Chloroflexota bacterium]MBT7080353.1 GNAT family N-acetyltransferase [Chloroflexota bacterium]MBT7290520.1 GNAT family N-acetyltransferase [Chloroflexota bacterium]